MYHIYKRKPPGSIRFPIVNSLSLSHTHSVPRCRQTNQPAPSNLFLLQKRTNKMLPRLGISIKHAVSPTRPALQKCFPSTTTHTPEKNRRTERERKKNREGLYCYSLTDIQRGREREFGLEPHHLRAERSFSLVEELEVKEKERKKSLPEGGGTRISGDPTR